MSVIGIITAAGLLAPSAATPARSTVRSIWTFASAPRTCAVLQAAYTAAIGRKVATYPGDVRSSERALELRKIVPEYRARLSMSAREHDGLAAREGMYRAERFKPACAWKGAQGPARDNEGHATFVTFTSPVFSEGGDLALVEVSILEEGMFGYGLICTARSRHGTWSARCLDSWIS